MNKRKLLKKENGITLTVLAITVVVLMLLAGITMLTFEDTNVIEQTEETVNTYYNDKQTIANEVDKMTLNLDKTNTN